MQPFIGGEPTIDLSLGNAQGIRNALRSSIDPLNPIAEEVRSGMRRTVMKPNAPSLLSHANLKGTLDPNRKRRTIVSAHHGRPRNTMAPSAGTNMYRENMP